MLERLGELLDGHLSDLDQRIAELGSLREEIVRYRGHVEGRRRRRSA
jgi:hypothetical protein